MNKNNVKVTFKGNPVNLLGNEIKVGDEARNFNVVSGSLEPKTLKDYEGKVKILSIFPSLDTPVCAAQNVRFNKEASALSDDIVILSISVDLPFAQQRFCTAEGINNLEVLSDYQSHSFAESYGFLIDGLKLLARGIVVIDKNNIVKHVEYVSEVVDEPDYEKAIEVSKSLL